MQRSTKNVELPKNMSKNVVFPQNMLKSNIWKKGGERGLPPKPTELPPSSHRRGGGSHRSPPSSHRAPTEGCVPKWLIFGTEAKILLKIWILLKFQRFFIFFDFSEVFLKFSTIFELFKVFLCSFHFCGFFNDLITIFQLLKVLSCFYFFSIFAGFLFYLLFWMEKLTNLQKRLSTYFLLICISAMKAPTSLHHYSNCTNVKISGMLPKLHKSTHLLRILMFSWGGCSF